MDEIFTLVVQISFIVGSVIVGITILGLLLWFAFIVWIRFIEQYKYYKIFKQTNVYWEHPNQQNIMKSNRRRK